MKICRKIWTFRFPFKYIYIYIYIYIYHFSCLIRKSEGWYGEGGGKRVQVGKHVYTCGGFMLMYGKTNTIL